MPGFPDRGSLYPRGEEKQASATGIEEDWQAIGLDIAHQFSAIPTLPDTMPQSKMRCM
jgi:hypothetical protein